MPRALITGASSGIGKATAERFAREGMDLVLIARRKDRLEKMQKELTKAHGVSVDVISMDITDTHALEAHFKEIEKKPLHIVVNNAGLALGTEKFQDYGLEDISTMITVNIAAMCTVARLSLPLLQKTKGHLINLGSIAGLETYSGGTVYCATKHFVHAFTEGLRKDLLGTGVRVTTIAPGRVDTEFSDVRLRGDTVAAKKVYQGYRPLHAEDIADAIHYAVSAPVHVNIEFMLVMPTDQAGLNVAPLR